MSTASAQTVLILGANGRFGRAAVQAFADAGWHVIAQSRSPAVTPLPRNAEALQCDALDTATLVSACAGRAQVIVNALNPQYTEWETRVGPLTDSVLKVARASGALLMLPGNVYNFGCRLPEQLTETTPQVADTSKARIRIDVERRMREAAADGVRSVVIRAGDFLGGAGPGTWMDMVMARKLDRNVFTYLGSLDLPHAWAYLPDLARVFVKVAERREKLRPFDVLHVEGLTLTGRELHAALERVTGRRLKIAHMPWWLLKLIAPLAPMMRALLEMRYLWDRPHRLNGGKLAQLIGEAPSTPLELVLRDSLSTGKESATGIATASSR